MSVDDAVIQNILDEEVINHVAEIFEEKGSNAWYEMEAVDLLPKGFTHPGSPNGIFNCLPQNIGCPSSLAKHNNSPNKSFCTLLIIFIFFPSFTHYSSLFCLICSMIVSIDSYTMFPLSSVQKR